jgi:hypothetical protein
MKALKQILVSALVGLVASAVAVTVVVLTVDPVAGTPGEKGEKGDVGPRGATGAQGIPGKDGVNGKDGKDATVNLSALTKAVIDEIDRRDDLVKLSFSGSEGTSVRSITISEAGTYDFSFLHFGADNFIVSIERPSGSIKTLVNSTGHVDASSTETLTTGTYKVHVTADGSWNVKIEQQ